MCGFAGAVSFSSQLPEGTAEKGIKRLHHRGPDGDGVYRSADGKAELGHARLSIIDLTGGRQPLSDVRDRRWLVANGELYGFEAIQDELRAQGHTLKTKSDSEIILPLYDRYGVDCLQRMRGEFAFALWDEDESRLFLGRDRFGIKPLFYAQYEGTLYFGSEIKALLAMGVPARWDLDSLWHGFHLAVPANSRSLFAGVRQVPPGHFLLADRNGIQIRQYWELDYTQTTERDERARIQGFQDLFRESVRLRLRADVPVGCYLSGGLDSCSAIGMAASLMSQPIHAFTLSFRDKDYDERLLAEETAKRVGAKFTPIDISEDLLADHFVGALRHAETWFTNPHGIAKYLLSQTVRGAGYKVVLTGEGSDEILAGYPHFRQDLLIAQKNQKGLEALSASNKVSQGMLVSFTEADLPEVSRRLGHVPSWMGTIAPATTFLRTLCSTDFLHQMEHTTSPYRLFLDETNIATVGAERDVVHPSMYLWTKLMLPNYLLTVLGDRMEMAHSVEGRVPFLDHHLVEYTAKLPIADKIHDGKEKYILREALKPYITDAIYNRQKHPFLAPPATHAKGKLSQLVADTLTGSALRRLEFLDATKVLELVDYVARADSATQTKLDPIVLMVASLVTLSEEFAIS